MLGYIQNFCSCSGLVTALGESQVFFGDFPKMASFASADNLFFALFFSKCCHLEHNQDNHLKPTPDVNNFPKFLWEVNSFLISPTTFELLNFEKWPHVALPNPNLEKKYLQFLSPLRLDIHRMKSPKQSTRSKGFFHLLFSTYTNKWICRLLEFKRKNPWA